MGLNIQDLAISSADFNANGALAARHANDDDNVPPTLHIQGVPDGTAELAIICHDPDAPLPHGFSHWTLYGLPADTATVGRGSDERFRPGPNDFGGTGYGGPQPPPNHGTHHYYFWVYALDTEVDGAPSRLEFLDRYGDHVIEQNRVVGTYRN